MSTLLHKRAAGIGSEAVGRFIKLIVAQALAEKASKIVFGEPCEAGCRRIPWNPELVQDRPWDWEDEARLTGRSEEQVMQEHKARVESLRRAHAQRHDLPIWFKIGDTYEELSPAPLHLYLEILAVVKEWNQKRISWEGERWKEAGGSPPTEGGMLSNFLLMLEDSRPIRASLAFEPSYCLSISLHETGKKI